MTSRYWFFTENNPVLSAEAYGQHFQSSRQFGFLVFQEETGENGTRHFQGYLGLRRERPLAFVRRNYSERAHWERRRGTHAEAIAYVTKEDTRTGGPFTFGEVPEAADQGVRSDLAAAIGSLRTGGLKRVAEEHPEQFVRFHRGLSVLTRYLPPPERPLPNVYLYYGPSGTGKTRTAIERSEAMGLDWHKQTPFAKFHTGIEREPPVYILDEFTGWWPLDYLLTFLDRYRLLLETKFGECYLMAEYIYITTNRHPGTWYDYTNRATQYAAIARRITGVVIFPGERELVGDELARFWSRDTCGPLVDEWI